MYLVFAKHLNSIEDGAMGPVLVVVTNHIKNNETRPYCVMLFRYFTCLVWMPTIHELNKKAGQ